METFVVTSLVSPKSSNLNQNQFWKNQLFLVIKFFFVLKKLFPYKAVITTSSVIWQKGKSQNGGNKNTKHAKFGLLCILVTSVLRFAFFAILPTKFPLWCSIHQIFHIFLSHQNSDQMVLWNCNFFFGIRLFLGVFFAKVAFCRY